MSKKFDISELFRKEAEMRDFTPTVPVPRDKPGLPPHRFKQQELMFQLFEELADITLKLQPGASQKDFSALSMILEGKRFAHISLELGLSQEEACEATDRAVKTIRRFLVRISHSKNAAMAVKEEYKEKMKDEKELIIKKYDADITDREEKYTLEMGKVRQELINTKKELNDLRGIIIDLALNQEKRFEYLRSVPIYKLPISNPLMSCLITADIENLGDIVALTQEEVAKIKDITPYLRELDHLIWASGLNYAQK